MLIEKLANSSMRVHTRGRAKASDAVLTAMLGSVEPSACYRRVLIAMHVSPEVSKDSYNAK
jgi:hypothetical protein